MNNNSTQTVKCVLVGDTSVGKTSLLITYTANTFPTEYIPSVFDNYSQSLEIQGQKITLHLWDTAGGEDYDRLRPLSYPNTNIFVICFSVVSPSSYENVLTKWYPEVKHHAPKVPHILVGAKIDLRQEDYINEKLKKDNMNAITYEQGKIMAGQIKAAAYMECSSCKQIGVTDVFEQVLKTGYIGLQGEDTKKKKKKGGCRLM